MVINNLSFSGAETARRKPETLKIFSMSYSVKSIAVFEKQAKRLIRKYASLKKELLKLIAELKENPEQGKAIGKNCFKILIAIASKGKAKEVGQG